jgi:ferrous iron transport protein A
MNPSPTLDLVPPGGSARVRRLSGEPALRERLAELGLTPGQEVRVLRRAPLGDPMEILLRGYRLAVRADEAARVEIEALP